MTLSFVDVLRQHAAQQPDHIALTLPPAGDAPEINLTFGELDRQARACAARLQRHIAPGDRVLLPLESELEFLVDFLGCLYAGAVAVPAAMEASRAAAGPRLQAILHDADISLIVASPAAQQRLEAQFKQTEAAPLTWLDPAALLSEDAAGWQPPLLDGRTLALLQYTSGSTGAPRGVMVNHDNLLFDMRAIQQALGYNPETPIVNWMPLFHDGGLILMSLAALFCLARLILLPPAAIVIRPIDWLRVISHYRAYSSFAPNFAYDLCVRRATPELCAGLDLKCWQVALNGAEPVCAATLERFSEAFAPYGLASHSFSPCYGLAEATVAVSSKTLAALPTIYNLDSAGLERGEVNPAAPDAAHGRRLVGCGPVVPGLQVAIAQPETGARAAPDQIGEIWLAGPGVAQGYWNQPEATARTFGARLADGSGPFLRTGDLGFIHHGELFIAGRLKDMLIIRGQNHYPQDIEATAADCHPALRPGGGAAFSVVVNQEERLVILHEVRVANPEGLDGPAVMQTIRRRVAEQHGLAVYAVALLPPKSLPKTTSGKLQRFAYRQAFLENRLEAWARWQETLTPEEITAAPPPDVDALVAQMWQEALGQPPAGPDDHFFDRGGDSLSALRLSLLVEERLGRPLPAEFFSAPTLANLSRLARGEPLTPGGQPPAADAPRQRARQTAHRSRLQRILHRTCARIELLAFRLPYRAGLTWLRWWCGSPLAGLVYRGQTRRLRQFLAALPDMPRSPDPLCRDSLVGDIIVRGIKPLGPGRANSAHELAQCFNVPGSPFWQPFYRALLSADHNAAVCWPYQIQGAAVLEPFRAQKRGVILLTLHTHSLWLVAPLLYRLGFASTITLGGGAAPRLMRAQAQAGIYLDRSTAWAMLASQAMSNLGQGGLVMIVGDTQDGRSRPLEAAVLGRAYPFKTSFAELALRSGAAIVPMMSAIQPDGQIRVVFHPPLDPGRTDQPHAERVAALVQQYAAFLETILQNEPENVSFDILSRFLKQPLWPTPNLGQEAAAVGQK